MYRSDLSLSKTLSDLESLHAMGPFSSEYPHLHVRY